MKVAFTFWRREEKPIDQISVKSLDEYPIIHSGYKKDWAKILE